MQRPIEEIKRRLLTCIDPEYNVTDMAACLELISKLEKIPITREVLESTRLGKYINDIRRKTSHPELYRRAKDLVRKWRKDVLADGVNGAAGSGPGPGGTGGRGAGNGHPPTSPSSLPSSGNTSPGMSAPTTPSTLAQRTRTASPTLTTAHTSRPLKPVSPALRGRVLSPGLSPAASSATTPPIATPTRSRSQPHSPAVNSSARQLPRADASSYAPNSENVSRNNAANKRLRKDDDEASGDIPFPKRPKNNVTNGFDEDSRDSFSSVLSNDCASKITSGGGSEGNRNRRIANAHNASKKKQVSESPTVTNTPDPLRQKMAAMAAAAKASKVKTTSQIVAELAVKKGDTKLAERASKLVEQHVREIPSPGTPLGRTSDPIVTRNKMDHMQRFLSSQPDLSLDPNDDYPGSEDEGSSMTTETDGQGTASRPITPAIQGHRGIPPPIVTLSSNLDLLGITEDETAEEILARLPPIDVNSIVWDDPDEQADEQEEDDEEAFVPEETTFQEEVEEIVRQSRKVPQEDIKTLHSTNLDCQNGNFDMDGKFREWHEVINKKGYQDDPVVVLPYVITDF